MYRLILIFILLPFLSPGQPSDKKAKNFLDKGNFEEAAVLYEKLSLKDPGNASYLEILGMCMTKMNKTAKAVEFYEEAILLSKNEALERLLMSAYMRNGEFIKAMDIANDKIKENPSESHADLKKLLKSCKVGQTLVAHPLNIEIENLGSTINSKEDDILPYLTSEGDKLVFSSNRRSASGKKLSDGTKPFEVFLATLNENKAKGLKAFEEPVNTAKTDIAVGMSTKNEMIFVFNGNSISSGHMHCYSNSNGKFSTAIDNFDNLKGYDLTNGVTISRDLQELYFASNHETSMGGLDIYMSKKLPNNEWSEPINIGEPINTIYNETFPQLAQYDKYLYFSSNGHPGMGERDLFRSERIENSWKGPKNLGYPLSTPLDDKNIALNEKGNIGYISSVGDDSFGGYDIYSFEFKVATLKHAVMLVYLSDDNDKSIQDLPLVVNDDLGNQVGTFYANANTKRYTLALKPGEYEIMLADDAYENYSEKIIVSPENLNKFNNEIRLKVSK